MLFVTYFQLKSIRTYHRENCTELVKFVYKKLNISLRLSLSYIVNNSCKLFDVKLGIQCLK